MFDKEYSLLPDPDFYTHLKMRIWDQEEKRSFSFALKPILFTALIALNLISVLQYRSYLESSNNPSEGQSEYELFADELNIESAQIELFNY